MENKNKVTFLDILGGIVTTILVLLCLGSFVLLILYIFNLDPNTSLLSINPVTLTFLILLFVGLVFVTIMVVNFIRGGKKEEVTPTTKIEPVIVTKEPKKEEKKEKSTKRFQKLDLLDKKYPGTKKTKITSLEGLTLPYLCERFRYFAASDETNPLYYSIEDIRRFISSLGVSKTLILQGMSGTGKTSLPLAFGRFIKNTTSVVPIQPMWKEKSDLLGYYNEFTDRFNESTILEKIYEANKVDKLFIIILDELNIARVEYYFSEFLSLLELRKDEERILEVTTLISEEDPEMFDHGKVRIPNNIWFIGTANNDDSTFAISDKVYDRAMIMNLDQRCEDFTPEEDNKEIDISLETFEELINKAQREYSLTRRGRERLGEFDKYIQNTFGITFGNRIKRQIDAYVPIYIACGGSEIEALDDMLSKKVLRKLESQNPVYVKNKSNELISKLNEIFGNGNMKNSIDYITKMTRNG